MLVGRSLIRPHKIVKVNRKIEVPDEDKNKSLPEGEVREVKVVSKKFPANFQYGEIVATGNLSGAFKVGDTVVFKPNRVINFELIKGVILVDDYDIIGVVDNSNNNIDNNKDEESEE